MRTQLQSPSADAGSGLIGGLMTGLLTVRWRSAPLPVWLEARRWLYLDGLRWLLSPPRGASLAEEAKPELETMITKRPMW